VAVLEREPDWNALPPKTPAKVRELLRHCLQKDAAHRLDDIAIARRAIEEVERGSNRWRLAAIAAAALAIAPSQSDCGCAIRLIWPTAHGGSRSRTSPIRSFSPPFRRTSHATFIRGNSSFFGAGQIFVKTLPNGEARQLTHDATQK